jgi:acetyl/propionyl-CoA carboxylase alpha subunit/acetyl-CoA carboxylase carboxyltransferase component
MQFEALLIANRGEVAIRVARAAAELGLRTVAVYSEDDDRSLHTRRADEARALRGRGAAAYLDGEQLIDVALAAGCDAIHPGYGFLSENAAFARRCAERGVTFVGPGPETLEHFGDKARARELAKRCGVPVLPGTPGATGVEEARDFLASLGERGAIMLKAVAGGGGRGMRRVDRAEQLEDAWARCRSEALAAFGSGELYAEQLLPRARHVEIQILGDRSGAVSDLGERECSLQRRHQKLIEIAPCPGMPAALRDRLAQAALELAAAVRFVNIGTFEFLLDASRPLLADTAFAFLEANPRLQVEHTVTEEVTGVDLVRTQLELAEGRTLAELGLDRERAPKPRGFAVQARINLETMKPDGTPLPAGGTLHAFEPASGPGIRVDSFGYVGYRTSASFDSLLAKLIAHSPSSAFPDVLARAERALREFRIEGAPTNLAFLRSVLRHPALAAGRLHTRFIEEHLEDLLAADAQDEPALFFESASPGTRAGARLATDDPLAVLEHGKQASAQPAATFEEPETPEGLISIRAPLQGTVVSIEVREGQQVRAGDALLVMEAMKMEHVIEAETSGVVQRLQVAVGDTLFEGAPLLRLLPVEVETSSGEAAEAVDLDLVRPDLEEVLHRHRYLLDSERPDAVERRSKTGQRTARTNVEDLCDPGSFIEYGSLVIAAQRRRRPLQELIERTPADGMIAGIGTVNADLFGAESARCVVLSYDYTVLAGTQGQQNHRKKDRMFELAERWRLPLVFFTEGGGGRPGDTDGVGVAGLDCMAFHLFGRLSGLVPLVAINSGRCFAGNAALLGSCDVVIATANSNIGMGGPAMIEGGGLGVFRPDEVGPMEVQVPNGVVDVAVKDEAEAVRVAKRYLSYFQGSLEDWECEDQRLLRRAIPENRLRTYDVRRLIETLADRGSLLELRRGFGHGMVTALLRIEGRPMGLVANNPAHLAGAIDSPGADKAARFLQLCDAFDLPVLFLCDTPGMMVGPEVEKTALVRHCCRLFVTGASLTVPFFTIVLRKGYGLGAQAMAGGSFRAPTFTVAWPTGEFGGMGLEGAVKLGYRNELAALEDPQERKALYDQMVARMYEHGKALNTASHFEIDDVIDPAESRTWISRALRAAPPPPPRTQKKRPCIDTW